VLARIVGARRADRSGPVPRGGGRLIVAVVPVPTTPILPVSIPIWARAPARAVVAVAIPAIVVMARPTAECARPKSEQYEHEEDTLKVSCHLLVLSVSISLLPQRPRHSMVCRPRQLNRLVLWVSYRSPRPGFGTAFPLTFSLMLHCAKIACIQDLIGKALGAPFYGDFACKNEKGQEWGSIPGLGGRSPLSGGVVMVL